MTKNYLIIGSGPAGITAAENIRNLDNQGEITVLSEERIPLFYRPRIPEYALGKLKIEEIMVKKLDYYHQKKIRLVLGVKTVKLDKKRKTAETGDGRQYGYDKLLIATGITPLDLSIPGRELEGIFTMHDLMQADQVRSFVKEAKQAVVVGGGLLGMDMAEELKSIGLAVDFLIRKPIIGGPFIDEYGCTLIKEEFERIGVNVLTSTEIRAFDGINGKLQNIITKDGRFMERSFCFLSIGAVPAVDWLKGSGLKIEKGVLVNEYLQSNDEDIFSAGNSAQIVDPVTKKQLVQTNWFNAIIQGRLAGNNMSGAQQIEYTTTSNYLKKVGTLSFQIIGLGNALIERGVRTYFKGSNPREYVLLTAKERIVVGGVICGLPKIALKLKEAIEKQKEIPNIEKLLTHEENPLDTLSEII